MTLHRKEPDLPVQPVVKASLIHVVDDPLLLHLVATNLVVRGYQVAQFGSG